MRLLITGGLGFIGSHLTASLAAEGHELVILDDLSTGKRDYAPSGATIIVDDVAQQGVFDEVIKTIDACYHLAAIASVERSHKEPERAHQVNSGGFTNLLKAIHQSGNKIPVVFASSAAVYGNNNKLPLNEESNALPISNYGKDKLACEKQGMAAALPNIGLRFFNVYGPNQDPASPYSGVISIFGKKILNGQPVTIFGDGQQSRDFIYVADVVESLKHAMNKLTSGAIQHGIYNICTGTEISIRKVAEAMHQITGTKQNITYAPARAGDIMHSRGNPLHAERDLGFNAKTSFHEGLSHTLAWMKEQV